MSFANWQNVVQQFRIPLPLTFRHIPAHLQSRLVGQQFYRSLANRRRRRRRRRFALAKKMRIDVNKPRAKHESGPASR